MKLHLNLSLRRALLAAMAAVATFAPSATAGVMHSDATYQTYTDFGQNCGRYVVGSKVNALLSHIRNEAGGITIDYTDGNDSYVISNEQGMISFNATHDGGHSTAIGPNFLATVRHNGSLNASFSERTVGSNYALNYEAIDINNTTLFRLSPEWHDGKYDYMLQRQSKIVTDVAWNPITTLTNEQIDNLDGGLVYHSGAGMMYQWDDETHKATYLATGYQYIIGTINGITNGLIQNDPKHPDEGNLSVLQDPHYGQIGLEGASEQNPLPNAVRPGDSGSPVFIYNTETNQYEYIAAQQSIIEPSFGQARGNVEWTHETLSAFDSRIDMSTSGTIHLGAVSIAGKTISETLNEGKENEVTYSTTLYSGIATDGNGNKAGEYIGVHTDVNTWCNLYDRRNIENWYAYQKKDGKGNVISDLQVSDEDLFYTQNLVFTPSQATNNIILDATVDLGIGYAEFNKGANMEKAVFSITAGTAGAMFNHAGYVINEGAEVHLKLVNPVVNETPHMTEWRKIGAGDLYIDGTGDTNALLNVGGSGKTYLQQKAGHAAYNVLVNSGATVIINGIGQIERDLTFGAGGGTLDLNGSGTYNSNTWAYDIDWYTTGGENRDGFTINALTEEAMITNSRNTVQLTYKQSGNTSYAGSFSDTANSSLIVVYDGGRDSTWTLNSIHTDLSHNNSSFKVDSGKVILSGTNTVHGMGSATATNTKRLENENDWHYADASMGVEIANGATFELGSHARLKGQVYVNNGGTFVIREAVKHQYEYVEGGSSLEDTYQYADFYGFKGIGSTSDIYLGGSEAKLTIKYSEGTTANTTIDASIYGKGSVSVDAGISGGSLTLGGNNSSMSGTKTLISGGLIATGTNSLGNTTTNKWKVQEKGWIASHAHSDSAADLLAKIDTSSTGILALSGNTANALNLTNYNNLYIGAEEGKTVDYGTETATLAAVNGAWRLGGGGGTLNVNFKLDGTGNLIIGNEYSTGTVNLTNAANKINGDIIIMGSGNLLTYTTLDALGGARVALSYGNSLALHSQTTLSLLSDNAEGIMQLSESLDLDMTGYKVALGASGKQTYTGKITLGENDSYRFGGSGHLTLDTVLDESQSMILDGQSNSGSSVTFARENAYTGGHIIAKGGEKGNLSGSIGIYAGHANSFADLGSMQLQKGATLYTDGYTSMSVQNLSASEGASIRNSGSRDTALRLNVTKDTTTEIADGVLNDANNSAGLSLVKTGEGTLTMKGNRSWSGGLTIKEGTVAISAGNGGVGTDSNVINIEDDGILRVTANQVGYSGIGNTIIKQKLTGTGTIEVANGKDMMLTQQAAGFEGTVHVMDNTRLYVGSGMSGDVYALSKYNTAQAFDDASIRVDSGSQVRITNSYYHVSSATVVSDADYFISGTGKAGTVGSELVHENLTDGALSIDCGSIITGTVTLEGDAMIASWSKNAAATYYNPQGQQNIYGVYHSNANNASMGQRYGLQGYLGGTIRGQILGEGMELTLGGNESMTFTADSANTFGDLVISNGNGNNSDKFALCLDGGKAVSQVSTALGLGKVTLNKEGLILRLAGTGTANQTDVVYTYGNDIDAGANATLQSHNITNKLTGTITFSDTLNLATAHGGVLELAGNITSNGTLNICENSHVVISGKQAFTGTLTAETGAALTLGSSAILTENSTITGTDSLSIYLKGTEAYEIGSIELLSSSGEDTTLNLNFDFTGTSDESGTWCSMSSAISATHVIIGLELNLFNELHAGEYTLISHTGNDITYSLADTMGGRLSLSSAENGVLTLIVGSGDYLYWTGKESSNWHADINWTSEKNGDTGFEAGAKVMLDSSGVATTDTSQTIILGSEVTEIDTLSTQEASYEILGEGELSGKSLLVGNKGELKLSNTGGSSFSAGVQVNDGTLEVSGGAFAADVTAENGGRFTLSDNATMTGDIKLHQASGTIQNANLNGNIELRDADITVREATLTGELNLEYSTGSIQDSTIAGNVTTAEASASISNSTVHGNINADAASSLALSETKLKGEVKLDNEFRIIAANNSNGTTYTEATISGSFDSVLGNSLTLENGAVTLDGGVSLDSLTVAAGTVTIWNSTATAGADKLIGSVALGKGATLQTNDQVAVTSSTSLGIVQLNGSSATIQDAHHSGSFTIDTLKLGAGITSSTLDLKKQAESTWSTLFKLGSETAEAGNFAGTIKLHQEKTGDKRSAFIILGNQDIARNAVIDLQEAKSANSHIGLGINTATATIAGLNSMAVDGGQAKLFSGTINEMNAWGTADATAPVANAALRTLTIDTAAGGNYTFNGEVMNQLNLVKEGAGKQTFAGTSEHFDGSIEINGGTLAFTGDALNMLGSASSVTVNGGTLDISSYDFNNGDTLQVNKLSISEKAVLALGNLNADTTYYFFSTTQDNWAALTTDNFSINGISLSDYGRVNLNLGMDGAFSFTLDESWDLVWNGGESGKWNTAGSNEVWQTTRMDDILGENRTFDTRFTNNDNVLFNSDANLELEGNIIVNNMEVADGVSLVTHGKLTVKGDLSVGTGISWDFSGDTTLSFTEEELKTAKAIKVGKDATLIMTDNADARNTASTALDKVSGEGTVVLDYTVGNSDNGVGFDFSGLTGTVQVESGRVLLSSSKFNTAVDAIHPTFVLNSGNSQLVFSSTQGTELKSNVVLNASTTFHVNANCKGSISGVISGEGGLTKAGDGTLTFAAQNTYTGTTTISSGMIVLASGGKYTLYNSMSGGTLKVADGTTLVNNGKAISSSLVLATGAAAEMNGGCTLKGDITINKDATLTFIGNGSDTMDYGVSKVLTVDGGTIDFGSTRQTMASWNITLKNGAQLLGAGGSYNKQVGGGVTDYTAAMDFNNNRTINVTAGANTIAANMRLRDGDSRTLTFNVSENASLDVSGRMHSDSATATVGNVVKDGAGSATISSQIMLGKITAKAGDMTVAYTGEGGNTVKNVEVQSGASLYMAKGAALNISSSSVEISGRTGKATLSSSTAGNYTAANDAYNLANGHIKSTAADVTISNKLTNSSVENAGGGVLTVTHTGNTISGVVASAGDVTLQNLAANTSLSLLEIAAGRTVNAYVGTNVDEKQGVSVASTGTALLSGGATLNTSLTLAAGATLDMTNLNAGAVTLNGALTFGGQVQMGEQLLAAVDAMSGWQELVLFTGLAGGVSLPSTVATNADEMVRASEVFSNVTNGNLYVSYQVIDNVGSLMVINVPEPATTTLSLLALTALAARRRRR